MALFFGLTIACYIGSSLGYQGYILFQKRTLYQIARIILLAGFICHTGVLALQFAEGGHIPVQNLHQTLSTFGWAVVGVFLVLQIKFHLMVLGALVAPLATVAVIVASMLPKPQVELTAFVEGLWRTVHMTTLILGNAALAIACLVGVLYLIQERTIKDKKRGFFFSRLPSLKLLDSVGYASLIVGFPLLTFGIISGVLYAQAVRGRFWTWDPKEIFAAITWLVFAILVHERLAVGWRGRRAAIMAIAGFAILVFTFFLYFLG
jgi:cytochrome c-type biogenesis protein CcsB